MNIRFIHKHLIIKYLLRIQKYYDLMIFIFLKLSICEKNHNLKMNYSEVFLTLNPNFSTEVVISLISKLPNIVVVPDTISIVTSVTPFTDNIAFSTFALQ